MKYGLYAKNCDEIIDVVYVETLSLAIEYFAAKKQLSIKVFNTIFTVKHISQ